MHLVRVELLEGGAVTLSTIFTGGSTTREACLQVKERPYAPRYDRWTLLEYRHLKASPSHLLALHLSENQNNKQSVGKQLAEARS